MHRITYDFNAFARIKDPTPPETEYHGSVRITLKASEKTYGERDHLIEKIEVVFEEDDGKGAANGVLCHEIRQGAVEAVTEMPRALWYIFRREALITSCDSDEDYGMVIDFSLVEVNRGK